jgi:hypothetical protein
MGLKEQFVGWQISPLHAVYGKGRWMRRSLRGRRPRTADDDSSGLCAPGLCRSSKLTDVHIDSCWLHGFALRKSDMDFFESTEGVRVGLGVVDQSSHCCHVKGLIRASMGWILLWGTTRNWLR